jgi:cephalosporin hydroxylase
VGQFVNAFTPASLNRQLRVAKFFMSEAQQSLANSFGQFPARPFLWFVTGIVKRSPFLKQAVIDLFENIYYDSPKSTWDSTSWLGAPCKKYPTDLWIYQEIIFENKPDLIIETGTLYGGSALYLGSLLDLVGHGRVISIDLEVREARPHHNRVTYVTGSSTESATIAQLEPLLRDSVTRMVILDSDHRKAHVEEELRIYSQYVTPGQYLIVEDSAINGHPVYGKFGPGPFEAIATFLKGTNDFVVDKTREKFFLSANHNGNLRRIR